MTKEQLIKVKEYIKDNIVMNPDIMFNDTIRGDEPGLNDQIDLIEVIVSLYELLNIEVTGEKYSYFFHWANKIGSWVNDKLFTDLIKEEGLPWD